MSTSTGKIKNKKSDIKSVVNKSLSDESMTVINCSGCSKETEINFIPDGVRPVFCHDCLKEYRREQSKLQQEKNSINKDQQSNKQKLLNENKLNKQNDRTDKGVIKVVQGKENGREKVNSQAVQNLIKNAMGEK